ncbi:hypothetical protein MalM25_12850 [Planctomycetes bacterium MalM25]|nr:hypothetical protein MalM25_12850 [Planctomycetes bacterium MalM25]
MPSRSTLRCATSIALATWLVTASPVIAQELTLPGDPLAGGQAESVDAPASATATDTQPSSGAAYSSSNGTMLGPTGQSIDIGPTSAYASGSVYNPTLGAHLRARYSSQSYGQQEGQLDLGTMRFIDLDGGIAFIDGQVTVNEESGVGYNVGLGYRFMALPLLPYGPDDEKIMGVSIWSDGQTIGQENFFSQVGVSLECLGEHIDFRANGYAPVSSRTQLRDGVSSGSFTLAGNGVSEQLRFVRDTALTVGEAELAGRLGNLDAWAFAGVYGFSGGQYDGVGGELGLRGYATPDLLLSISVANDDEFDTNAIFAATWFIGRTRAENCPTGTLADRFREPVMRNTYIATQQDSYLAAGDALLDDNGAEIRLVHFDSNNAANGDGTFENPFNTLDSIDTAGTQDGDILYAHGGSNFADQTGTLKDNQTLVGEGAGNVFQITTNQFGTIDVPETAPGAQAGPVPIISGAASGGIVLADNNTVQNLEFDGVPTAITNDATNGSFNPNLNNLTISNTTGDAISLATVIRTDADDFDGDGDTSETLDALGTVTIDEIAFNNVGGHDISIDGNATDATDESGQTINISNITSTGNITEESIALRNTSSVGTSSANISDFNYVGGGTGQGAVELDNTSGPVTLERIDIAGSSAVGVTALQSTGAITINNLTYDGGATGSGAVLLDQTEGTVTMNTLAVTGGTGVGVTASQATGDISIDGLTYDGEATATGALLLDRTDGQVDVSNSTITGGGGAGPAVEARQTTGGVSLASTVVITDVNGEAVLIDRAETDGTSTVAINSNIVNSTVDGGGVRVLDNTAVVNFGGNITTQNTNSVTITDSKANITFSGAIDDNGTGDAITITNAGLGTANTAEVLFSPGATINNDEGRVLVVDNGDDNIAFNDTVTDTGDGILITDRQSGADITFESAAALSLTDQTAAITMTGNNDASSVNINGDLTINSTGTGITSNGGELNIANPNGTNSLTSTDTAINLTGGSSTGGVNFNEVTSTGGAVAVNLNNFDGTVDINGGQLGSTAGNTAVTVTDSSLDLDGVDITSGSGTAVQAIFNGTTNARTLRVANGNLNSDNVIVTTSGNQDATVTLQDLIGIGDTDLNVGGSGAVDATMTDVTGFGDITLDVSLSGDADLSLTRVNTAGILAANSTAGSAGDLTVDVENSGNTSAFTSVVFNEQGAGNGTLTFNNSETTSGVNFDSVGGGGGSLTVDGSTLGGGINYDTAGSGNSTLTVLNATVGGDIDYNSGTNGASNFTVTGGSVAGSILGDATGTGNFISRLAGASITNGRVALNAANTGDALFNISGFNFDTGNDDTAIDVAFATTIDDADLTVINNTGVTTGNNRALNVDINGADVDFQIANNLFTNNSPLATDARAVFIDVSGSSTTNATITDNVFTNSDATGTVQFEIATTAGNPNLNLNFSGNTANSGGGTGNGEMIIRESAGTVSVFELSDTFSSPTRNTGTVTFDPNNEPDFDDLPAAPALPNP